MQAEKSDTETEKNEAGNDATATSVANEVTNLKIEDGSTSSTPSSPGSTQPGNFLTSFKAFSKFGDPKSDGKLITLSQSDKWMKQAKVIDGKKINTTDTGIYFKKHKYVSLYRNIKWTIMHGCKIISASLRSLSPIWDQMSFIQKVMFVY